MSKKYLIIAKPNAHGVLAAVISYHNLSPRKEVQILCDGSTSTSQQFWDKLGSGLSRTDRIIAINYHLPTDPHLLAEALDTIRRITSSGGRITFVTHLKPQLSHWGYAVEAGARVIMTGFAHTCYFGKRSDASKKLSRILSICCWHPVSDATGEERTIAAGIHKAVRCKLLAAIAHLKKGDLDWFHNQAVFPQIPSGYEDDGFIAFTRMLDPLDPVQHLCEIASRLNVPYAVGFDLSKRVVVGVRNWAYKRHLAVPFLLGLCTDNHGGAHVTMEGAVTFNVNDKTANSKAAWLRRRISEPLPEDLAKAPGRLYQGIHKHMGEITYPRHLTDHGWPHLERVVQNTLGLFSLASRRHHNSGLPILRHVHARRLEGAAMYHDSGQGFVGYDDNVARINHHSLSQLMIEQFFRNGLFTGVFSEEDARAIGQLSLLHRGSERLPRDPLESLIAAILRLGDGLDIDYRRGEVNSYGENALDILAPLKKSNPAQYKIELDHIAGHLAIQEVRVIAKNSEITIELVVTDPSDRHVRFQLARLQQEVDSLSRKGLSISVTTSVA